MDEYGQIQLNAIERKNLLKTAEQLFKSTHFTREETEKLLYKYRAITSDRIDRVKFRDLLHDTFGMSDDFFMDRVFRAFDKDTDGYLSQEEWVCGLSVFLRGTLDEKIKFCFFIYDLNSDGQISREEMFQMLKNTMVKQPTEEDPDEGIKDLVEMMFKRMDQGHQKVTLDEYKATVTKERLLIEAFGPCLPQRKCVEEFCDKVFL